MSKVFEQENPDLRSDFETGEVTEKSDTPPIVFNDFPTESLTVESNYTQSMVSDKEDIWLPVTKPSETAFANDWDFGISADLGKNS